MKILLIDNYDSFTFNLYHYVSSLGVKVDVVRNDKITHTQILKIKYDKIIISPGPGNPNQSGNCIKIVKALYRKIANSWSMFRSSNYWPSFRFKNYSSKKVNAWEN